MKTKVITGILLTLFLATFAFNMTPVMAQTASATIYINPESVFEDNFSNPVDTAAWWTIIGGTWTVEAGEYSGESDGVEAWTYVNTELSGDMKVEFRIKFLTTPSDAVGKHGGIMSFATSKASRWSTSGYTIDWIDRTTDRGYRIYRWDSGVFTLLGILSGDLVEGQWYDWKVIIAGSEIELYVDGVSLGSVTDTSTPYTSGYIGLWLYSNGQHAHFDDFVVYQTPTLNLASKGKWITTYIEPQLMFKDNFESYGLGADGSPTWTATSGTWIIEEENGNKVYSGSNPTGPGGFAISSLTLGTGPMIIETDFVEQGDSPWQNGLILFDYNSATDFKAAGAAVGADEWRIQHYDGSWQIDAKLSETIDTLAPYHLKIVIEDNKVTLYANDDKKLDYTFSSIGTGKIGLFSVNAHAHFDDVLVTNFDVNSINVSTVFLGGTVQAELKPWEIGDYDEDGVPDLMVKFDRTAVIEYIRDVLGITDGYATLAITDGTLFEGSDTIRVISKGK